MGVLPDALTLCLPDAPERKAGSTGLRQSGSNEWDMAFHRNVLRPAFPGRTTRGTGGRCAIGQQLSLDLDDERWQRDMHASADVSSKGAHKSGPMRLPA